jgi:hypothetical protein
MMFNIDTENIVNAIGGALDAAGSGLTEQMMEDIVNQIDNAMPGIIDLIIQDAEEHWKESAAGSGTGWGQKYANAIKSKISDAEGEVYVDETVMDKSGKPASMFAKMIEEGVKSWSIKDALLKSEKAKMSKDGVKYIIIPFPVAAPRKKGQGKQLSSFGGRTMTSDVYSIVKNGGKAPAGTMSTSGKDISGLSKWESQKYHGGYGIFRVVSEKSQGWIHPGAGARPIFGSVNEYVQRRIGEIVSELCASIVKMYSA